jgi:hypothetical protein
MEGGSGRKDTIIGEVNFLNAAFTRERPITPRVDDGGHGIRPETIRHRFDRGLKNYSLPEFIGPTDGQSATIREIQAGRQLIRRDSFHRTSRAELVGFFNMLLQKVKHRTLPAGIALQWNEPLQLTIKGYKE